MPPTGSSRRVDDVEQLVELHGETDPPVRRDVAAVARDDEVLLGGERSRRAAGCVVRRGDRARRHMAAREQVVAVDAGRRRLSSSKPSTATTLAGTLRTGALPVIVTRPAAQLHTTAAMGDDAVDDGEDVVEPRAERRWRQSGDDRRAANVVDRLEHGGLCHASVERCGAERSTTSTRMSHHSSIGRRPSGRNDRRAAGGRRARRGARDSATSSPPRSSNRTMPPKPARGVGRRHRHPDEQRSQRPPPTCRGRCRRRARCCGGRDRGPTSFRGAGVHVAKRSRSSTVIRRRRRTGSKRGDRQHVARRAAPGDGVQDRGERCRRPGSRCPATGR